MIAVLREAGLPVPIELSEAARALSRELRPKAIRLEHVTILPGRETQPPQLSSRCPTGPLRRNPRGPSLFRGA